MSLQAFLSEKTSTLVHRTNIIFNTSNLNMPTRQVFSFFPTQAAANFVRKNGKLNAIYQKYNIKVSETQPYVQGNILNRNALICPALIYRNNQVLSTTFCVRTKVHYKVNKKLKKERENDYSDRAIDLLLFTGCSKDGFIDSL